VGQRGEEAGVVDAGGNGERDSSWGGGGEMVRGWWLWERWLCVEGEGVGEEG
jgi:hypothetical protein